MKNRIKILGIIALLATIGFSMISCGDGGGGGGGNDTLNGSWLDSNGDGFRLKNGSFECLENNKVSIKGTYTAGGKGKSVSGSIAMAVNEMHGDLLKDAFKSQGMNLNFESKFYTKSKFKDFLTAQIGSGENEISVINDFIKVLFPTLDGTYTGKELIVTMWNVTFTFPKKTSGSGSGSGGSSALVARWYNDQSTANSGFISGSIYVYEFTSKGKLLTMGFEIASYTVSGNTISVFVGGVLADTADYSINGTKLTISNVKHNMNGTTILQNGSFYKPAR